MILGLFHVRQAAERDREPLALMLDRCSAETVYRRFHGRVSAFPERYLTEALSGVPAHLALVAVAGDGSVAALASCRAVGGGTADLGLLVEDAWQRLGLGTRLLSEIIDHAERTGLTALSAQVLSGQAWIIRMLRRHGTCVTTRSGPVLDVTLRLACAPPVPVTPVSAAWVTRTEVRLTAGALGARAGTPRPRCR
jgi:GNAT superfamily N-acetyltransferase